MERSTELTSLLAKLQQALESQNLWQQRAPSAESLASQMPFCYDTLTFPEWVQWVFIPKLQRIAPQPDHWPKECAVAPMAEEYFKTLPETTDPSHQGWVEIIAQLRQIDLLITQRH